MKKLVAFILAILVINSYSKANSPIGVTDKEPTQDFLEFIKYFENKTIEDNNVENIEIPLSLFECVIGLQCVYGTNTNEKVVSIKPLQLLNNNTNITIVYQIIKSESGETNDFQLMTFTTDGLLKKSKMLGSNEMISVMKKACEIHFYEDMLLEVIQCVNIIKDDKEVVREKEYVYYQIDEKGFHQFFPEYTLGRQFPFMSTMVLNVDDLKFYSNEQLKIIKNEVYAEHGYIFSSEQLKEYYGKFDWYAPKNDDVDSYITAIEKINVQIIDEIINE